MVVPSHFPHGQQGSNPVNNSSTSQYPNDRAMLRVTRMTLASVAIATLCGCHYCPHNRYTPRPGYCYASDDLGRPYACHPGGRRESRFYGGGYRDQGGCLSDQDCVVEDGHCYYPRPQSTDETPALESPTDAPVEGQQSEDSPLTPFTPTENFPPPPSTVDGREAVEASPPAFEDLLTPIPLFEGRVNTEELEPPPVNELVLPQAPTSSNPPALPLSDEAGDAAADTENDNNGSESSLFPLRFPPRLFRLPGDEDEVEIPTPPVAEASASRGMRFMGGHSRYAPQRAATPVSGLETETPESTSSDEQPPVRSSIFGSLRFR